MHFLRITDFNEQQIMDMFCLADKLKTQQNRRELAGKTAIVFFPESSVRTRISFEKAIHNLGGYSLLFHPKTLDKREALQDVIPYLENWADMAIIRHDDIGKLLEIAEHASIPVINAMTSVNHPCEILSDLYTLRNMRKEYRELVYTFVGELGNISRTWADIALVFNLRLNHVCCEGNRIRSNDTNYTFCTRLEDVLPLSDVILTDSLSEQYRNDDYYQHYQITPERMASAKKGAILNPCPPFYRNQEVSHDVIESPYFVGYQFKENLLVVQQAIMLYCLQNTKHSR
jgi:ornithine carbamoyltransferase